MGRADGLTDEQLDALETWATSSLFTEDERAALAWADAIVASGAPPDEVFADVQRAFTAEQILELTAAVVWEIAAAKFNRALDIEAQGVCRIKQPGHS